MISNVSPAAAFGFPVDESTLNAAAARALETKGDVAVWERHGYGSAMELLDHEIPPSELPAVLEKMGVEPLPFSIVEMGDCYKDNGTSFYISARGWSVSTLQGEICSLPLPSQDDLEDLISAVEFLGLEDAPPFNFHIGFLIH